MERLQPCIFHWSWTEPPWPLQPGVYSMRHLIERTIQHGMSLDGQGEAEARDKLTYALIEGWHEVYEGARADHYLHLCRCAALLDQYFLGGFLTQVDGYRNRDGMLYLKIRIEDDNDNCEGSYSCCTVDRRDGGHGLPPLVRIDIDSDEPFTIAQMIGILVHEMVHGYVELFSCRGGFSFTLGACCCCDYGETSGRHGRWKRRLLEHVFETIRSWEEDLFGDFGSEHIRRCNHRHYRCRADV